MDNTNKNDIINNETIKVTKEGLKNYKERLDYLISTKREEVAVELQNAREQGDLSENAEYDEAKNKQADVEQEIYKIQDILSRVEVIEAKDISKKFVSVGSLVTIKASNQKEEQQIEIVSNIETDPFASPMKLSNNSPLVNAIMGKEAGSEEHRIEAPKPYKVKIVKIQ